MQRRVECFRSLIFIFFIVFFIWILLQFLAPIILPSGSVEDLSGSVGLSDNEETINSLGFPWNMIYSSGDVLCHQRLDRSFMINGNEMPFCARCTAIWLGLAVGLGFIVFYKIELNEKLLFLILFALIPMGIDGIGQLFGLWESTNLIRVLTGLPVGFVCGLSIGIIIDELKTIRFYKKSKSL